MTDIQRPNYFTSQFLIEADFNEEQAYHRDMRKRHNRSLHEWGVVEGLEVSREAEKQIAVTRGMAIDNEGRDIIILSDSPLPDTINLDGLELNTTIEITIIYREIPENPYQVEVGGVTKYTRTAERPKFVIYGGTTRQDNLQDGNVDLRTGNVPTDGTVVRLAQVRLDNNGNVSTVDNSVRKLAGAKLPSPRQFIVDIAEDDQTISVPAGTTVDDWVIFVSPRELAVQKSGAFVSDFEIEVSAEPETNGWRIRCYSQDLSTNTINPGTANYMLLRK
ncbi:MAG: hypothetical protein F6K50_19530 [Moorea sp. SIO3I7]|uniref:hypothetical protein n=1 Tax=unclassified Moorena TaxID=2683338 RepID=UPI0013C0031B|nr:MULTISPECIES: hypothetical protein [unclassified Moorena]NEN97636.1 hypothetical protein [Moorena sp. SIO3I7]NEO08112.1 hypothetical protein [Moorena sp. SIO3I8]NEP23523.1 hypothetical protein [Moorena sp. SIO3I6]